MVKKFILEIRQNYWPYLLMLALIIVVFREFFIFDKVPVPYDMLTGWYFPYTQGGWEGYYPGIAHKGGLHAADVIRQMIPWKQLSLEQIRNGELPLWNPYNFSGEPLLANPQVFIFYPLTLLFQISSNFNTAWSYYIISSPLLTLLFSYWFLRSIKLSKYASFLGGASFAFSGHMISWLEWGVVTHSALWMPLILWGITKWLIDQNNWAPIIIVVGVFATITGGYPQESAYVFLVAAGFFGYQLSKTTLAVTQVLIVTFVMGTICLVMAVPQLIPTYNLYQQSSLKGSTSKELFLRTQYHPVRAMTMFAPDYFGSRVKENYWGDKISQVDYTDGNLFIGSTAFVGCVFLLFSKSKKHAYLNFFVAGSALSFLLAIPPTARLLSIIQIPMISTGDAAGIIIITSYCLTVVGAIGIDSIINQKKSQRLGMVLIVYGLLMATIFLVPSGYQRITFRGVIPYVMVGTSCTLIFIIYGYLKNKWLKKMCLILVLLLACLEAIFYSRTMLSFSPRNFSYPKHDAIEKIKEYAGYERVVGFFDADIAPNLHTGFRIYNTQGYNPLHLKHYQFLSSATKTGQFTTDIERSDAIINDQNIPARDRFFELTSTKYVLAKVTDPREVWETQPLKYNDQTFKLVWQETPFKIYQKKSVIPRVSIYNSYQVITDVEERINWLYDPESDIYNTVILETSLPVPVSMDATGSAQIVSYSPNKVVIDTDTYGGNSILLLTDSYYHSWKATINTQPTNIYKANQSFRAVLMPPGKNTLTFQIYWP